MGAVARFPSALERTYRFDLGAVHAHLFLEEGDATRCLRTERKPGWHLRVDVRLPARRHGLRGIDGLVAEVRAEVAGVQQTWTDVRLGEVAR